MSGEEQRVHARAEMLEETGDLAQAVSDLLAGAQGAGRRPAGRDQPDRRPAHPGPRRRHRLRPRAARKDRQDGSGYGSDGEFLEALSDAEDQVRERLREVTGTPGTGCPGPRPRAAGPRAGPPRPGGGPRRAGRRLRHEHQGASATAATEPRPPRSRPPRPPSPTPRPGSRTPNAGSASARPPPTSSTRSPSGWPGRWPSCGRCPRTSARSTSWSMRSSGAGGNCPGTPAGSKGRTRDAGQG